MMLVSVACASHRWSLSAQFGLLCSLVGAFDASFARFQRILKAPPKPSRSASGAPAPKAPAGASETGHRQGSIFGATLKDERAPDVLPRMRRRQHGRHPGKQALTSMRPNQTKTARPHAWEASLDGFQKGSPRPYQATPSAVLSPLTRATGHIPSPLPLYVVGLLRSGCTLICGSTQVQAETSINQA